MISRQKICTLFLLSCFALMASGYIQTMTFHEELDDTGNYFVFRSNVPDISQHSSLANCKRYCFHGGWYTYSDANYSFSAGNGEYHTSTCFNKSDWGYNFQSFRHFGSSDTSVDALTIYEILFEDNNILITNPAAGDLEFPSYAIIGQTGPSPWTLFEGPDFDGPRVCIPGTGKNGTALYYHIASDNGMNGIGSVVRGCFEAEGMENELKEIRDSYRRATMT